MHVKFHHEMNGISLNTKVKNNIIWKFRQNSSFWQTLSFKYPQFKLQTVVSSPLPCLSLQTLDDLSCNRSWLHFPYKATVLQVNIDTEQVLEMHTPPSFFTEFMQAQFEGE